jgi:predicted  nucleic acid-binding Zn-ribbon protein
MLLRAIRNRVNNTRCLSCRYSLLGLTVHHGTDGLPWVQCPECGAKLHLYELGLLREDLIP